MINQEFHNITQNGNSAQIQASAEGLEFSPVQGYCIITGFFLTLIVLIICIKQLCSQIVAKSCIGCKRLAKCEKAIKELKKESSINTVFDKNIFNELSQKLENIIKELKKHG